MTITETSPVPAVSHTTASHTLNVPATRGKMGNTVYYTANFPLGMVVRLFSYDPSKMSQLPVEQRTQRALKATRIPEIADYILEGDDYFFSSLTVSVNAEWLEFVPAAGVNDNVGILKLPMETDWIINDGQHRVAGIAAALEQDPTLRSDNISVVVLPDAGLERSQQIFSDLNRTVLKTSRSLDILFDHRSPTNRIATHVVNNVRLFRGKIDKERTSLAANSSLFATLSGVQQAIKELLGDPKDSDVLKDYDTYESRVVEFWDFMTTLIEPWQDIASGTMRPSEARQSYISSYQMMIAAVGTVGGQVMAKSTNGDWKAMLAPLKNVDWRKTNPEWQGLVMVGTEVVTRVTTRRALSDFLRWKVGLIPERPRNPLNVGAQVTSPAPAPKVTETEKTASGAVRRGRPPKAATPAPAPDETVKEPVNA